MPAATHSSYLQRRSWIETYFDRTAAEAWSRLTSDAPVSGVRRAVREGRDRMRALLLSWLPADLGGYRILDAGCGPGQMAQALAERGARVVAVDLSPTLVQLARERLPERCAPLVEFRSGDMLDPGLGEFDVVVAMDSLIHYRPDDAVHAVARLSARVRGRMLFTFVPSTPGLALLHALGRLFPRGDRAPAVEPVRADALGSRIAGQVALRTWRRARTERVSQGFYTSQALELVRQ
jgi:magnesium-protoporphyrin O-methyltransferase